MFPLFLQAYIQIIQIVSWKLCPCLIWYPTWNPDELPAVRFFRCLFSAKSSWSCHSSNHKNTTGSFYVPCHKHCLLEHQVETSWLQRRPWLWRLRSCRGAFEACCHSPAVWHGKMSTFSTKNLTHDKWRCWVVCIDNMGANLVKERCLSKLRTGFLVSWSIELTTYIANCSEWLLLQKLLHVPWMFGLDTSCDTTTTVTIFSRSSLQHPVMGHVEKQRNTDSVLQFVHIVH